MLPYITGQVLQVQLGENSYQNYITYTDGEVIPVELITQVKAESLQVRQRVTTAALNLFLTIKVNSKFIQY